ncbi:TRAP transporter small permease [Oceanobacillus timonensis]|uniref:TRAP transporter small permease n=1 Tax=Oceanobacillus timonensis TaxID=1926285 RepID=UPI0015C41A19|nr:TRAP transporter small permease [Oceanobacillus timonensis]
MRILRRIDEIWEKIEAGILSITIISISLMLVGNTISRYFFSKSWPFTEELGKVGIIILTFMGLGYAARKGMHIEMSGFYDLMSEKAQRILGIFINLISALVLVFCTYLGMKYIQHLYTLGQVSTILRIPLYLTMMFVPIGFFLASIRYFVNFGKRMKENVQDSV